MKRIMILALCLAGCTPQKPPEAEFDAIARTDFNTRAAERFLPLFWVEDANRDGALQPDELAVLHGLPDAERASWIDTHNDLTPRFREAYGLLKQPTPAASARERLVLQELAQGAPTLVASDFRGDSEAERVMVRHLVTVAGLIERLHARQTGTFGLEAGIPVGDASSRAMFHRNQSPFCEAPATEKDPQCSAIGPKPTRISGLYPKDIQDKPGFCQRLEREPNADALRGHFSVVVAAKQAGRFEALPFSQAWPEDMSAVARELDAAAAALGSTEPALVAYLRAAAQAFRDDNWEPADRAWKAMNASNSRWYVRIAPDEVYGDPCAWKAGFALQFARINPDSLQWQQKLDPLRTEFEQQLAAMAGPPYRARAVHFALPDFIDVVLNAGDQRNASGATIGQSLPNWGPVAAAGGRTVSMTNLYTDPDSLARRDAQQAAVLCKATDAEAREQPIDVVLNSLLHEAAHNLGPAHDYAVAGRTAPVAFGGPLASTLEELKAQNSALWLAGFLVGKDVLKADEHKRLLREGVTWAFGHISRGMYGADGTPRNYSQLAAIQVGSFLDAGALAWRADETAANGSDKGCMAIDYAKLPAAVEALEKQVLGIKARADREAALKLTARYVDGTDAYSGMKSEIAARYLRVPKASFVYSLRMP